MHTSPSSTTKLEFSLREALSDDFLNVIELYKHLHSHEEFSPDSTALKNMWQRIITDERIHCFVAQIDSKLVGTSLIDIVPNLTRGARPFAVLQNVVVHNDYQSKGIGTALNQYALDFAWKENCYQVLVQTGRPEAAKFYQNKLGFTQEKIGLVAKPI